MRRTLVILLVAGSLVGGAVAYALVSGPSAATAQAEDAPADTDTDGVAQEDAATDDRATTRDSDAKATHSGRGDILGDELDDAVAGGVITQEQADQLRRAWDAKREELRGEFRAGRGDHEGRVRGGIGADIQGLLEDGVIDADELAGLPDDHPLNDPDGPAAEFLADGQITEDELRELLPGLRGGAGYSHGGANQDSEGSSG